MKTEIWLKINNTEQCKAVQKVCFDNGIFWNTEYKEEYKNFNAAYIFIHKHAMRWDSKVNSEHPFMQVNTDLFIATNGSCKLEDLYSNKAVRKNITFETVLVTKLNGNIIGGEIMNSDINLIVNDVVKCIFLDQDNGSVLEVGKEYIVVEIDRFDTPEILLGELSEDNKVIEVLKSGWCYESQLKFIGRCQEKDGKYFVKYNEGN